MPDEEAVLQWATRLIDEQVGWYGLPTYPDQALALPQVGLVDQWGRQLASHQIPTQVQNRRRPSIMTFAGLLGAAEENGTAAATNSGCWLDCVEEEWGRDPYPTGISSV